MTNFLLLIGSGLFARAIAEFQENSFNHLLGGGAEKGEAGTGPGSFDVRGNVWHLECCSPKNKGWLVFNGMFGWSNNASGKFYFHCIKYILLLMPYCHE
jgi:high-affinity iron transporter